MPRLILTGLFIAFLSTGFAQFPEWLSFNHEKADIKVDTVIEVPNQSAEDIMAAAGGWYAENITEIENMGGNISGKSFFEVPMLGGKEQVWFNVLTMAKDGRARLVLTEFMGHRLGIPYLPIYDSYYKKNGTPKDSDKYFTKMQAKYENGILGVIKSFEEAMKEGDW